MVTAHLTNGRGSVDEHHAESKWVRSMALAVFECISVLFEMLQYSVSLLTH